MRHLLVLGAGRIGAAIASLLLETGQYQITLADANSQALTKITPHENLLCKELDITDSKQLERSLLSVDAVLSACPYQLNKTIALAALNTGASYFDLTEDVETADYIQVLSTEAKPGQKFVPQCGLAPGFISILARDIVDRFESVESVKMRVGALPEFPNNQIMYNLTWSTEGLLNEYCQPCRAIRAGRLVELQPLEGLESFSLDGLEYEAFNTSGGLGTLCQTLQGKVRELTYKTIRYKGHQYLMRFLINDLRLGEQPELLKSIVERAVAITRQDVVIVMVSVVGQQLGQLTQVTDTYRIYHRELLGNHWSAIQITTAASICAVVDLFFDGLLPSEAFVRQESISLCHFLKNRFGRHYLNRES